MLRYLRNVIFTHCRNFEEDFSLFESAPSLQMAWSLLLYNDYQACILHMNLCYKAIYLNEMIGSLVIYIHFPLAVEALTHWGQMTHICINKQTIIGSDNGLSPCQCQTIIWTNAGKLLIGPSGTNQWNLNQHAYISIQGIAFENVWKKMAISSWPQCVK